MKEDILRAVGSIMAQGENLNFVGKYDNDKKYRPLYDIRTL